MARLGVPVGGRVKTLRAVGDSSGPSWDNVHEQLGRIIFDHSLRPCLGEGASLGKEAVLADSGRAGENVGLFEHPAKCISVNQMCT